MTDDQTPQDFMDTTGDSAAEALDMPELGSSDSDGDSVSTLQNQLDTALAQVEEFKSALQRERADFSNFRKRMEKEKSEMRGVMAGETIRGFLPIFDDLDRAISTLPDEWKESDWFKGFSLIGKKFNDLLESYGIRQVNPLGEPFDHNCHDAIGSEDSDQYASGTVIEVLQKGYILHGKCIRPAIVRVAN